MLENIKITKKFPLFMVSFAIISAITTGIIAFNTAKQNLTKASESNIISLLESRKHELSNYITTIKGDVDFHGNSPLIISAIQDFSNAWKAVDNNKTQYLQNAYITQNPFPIGDKGSLLSTGDNTDYDKAHKYYHPILRHLINARDFHDLFLFDTKGNLIYTVVKEGDFAENLVTGQWKNTNLARMYMEINNNPQKGQQVFVDFEHFHPSADIPASFIGTAIFDQQNNYIGVLAFEMSISQIDNIMHVTAGMGKTGETYLVGPDLLLRSNSRFFPENSILEISVDTVPVQRAINGESGLMIAPDYRDKLVFSAFTPIDYFSSKWLMLADIEKEEVMAPVHEMSRFLLISGLLIAIVITFLGSLLARNISLPIVSMTKAMGKLAKDNLDTNISVSERKDEVGSMAQALLVFKKNAIERKAFINEISYLANHDSLTGLRSRKYAMEQLDVLIQQSQQQHSKLALLFIDLDEFKPINDTYGHHAGDDVLKQAAAIFLNCVKSSQGKVARLGGDEFIVLIPDVVDMQTVKHVAEQIIENIKNKIFLGSEEVKVTASIGIVTYPYSADDGPSLLKQADNAMYQAKSLGKNQYYLDIGD